MKNLILTFGLLSLLVSCETVDTTQSPDYGPNTQKYFLGSFNMTSTKSIYLTGDEGQYKEQILWAYDSEDHTITINNNTEKTKEVIDVTDMMDGKLLFTSQETEGTYSEIYDCTKIARDTLEVETSYGKENGKALYIK